MSNSNDAQNDTARMLKVALLIQGIVQLVYGVAFLLTPGLLVAISGAAAVDYGWLRWSGGLLAGLAYGSFRAFRNPTRQGLFVTTMAYASLLTGVGFLIATIAGEYTCATWFIVLPMVISFGLAVLIWWGRSQAKAIL
jgi:hypothetical protein